MATLKNITDKNYLSLDNICYLVDTAITEDDIGNQIEANTETLCYCAEVPIARNEFYQAGQSGIKSEICLLVDTESYGNQTKVKYNDKTYAIYRTYPSANGMSELYLTEKAGEING